MRALFGALSTQTGAFDELNGPDARALIAARGVRAGNYFLPVGFQGNLGYLHVTGVNAAPIVARGYYFGQVPQDLTATLTRPDPATDPSLQR